MKNAIAKQEAHIMNLFNLTPKDIYSEREFPSKEITDQETWEVKQSWSMKSISLKGLIKNNAISFKLFEKKDAQIVKYNRDTQKENFVVLDKAALDSDLLQIQAMLSKRSSKSTYTVEDFCEV